MPLLVKYSIEKFAYDISPNFYVLQNIYFSVSNGEKVEIKGPNGAGKTTFLNLITGVLDNNPTQYVEIVDRTLLNVDIRDVQSFVPDSPHLLENLTVSDNVNFFMSFWNDDKNSYLKRIELFFNMFQLNDFKNKIIRDLSLGTRQKIFISVMLSRNVNIYVLDEPFNALDIDSQNRLAEFINQDDKAYIIVSHINVDINFNKSVMLTKSGVT